MELAKLKEITALLKENDFLEIDGETETDIKKKYLKASSLARKLETRLPLENLSELLLSMGLKTFYESVALPASNELNAFTVRYNEEDNDYYIQIFYHLKCIDLIDNALRENTFFQEHKVTVDTANQQTVSSQISHLAATAKANSVFISVLSTGFGGKKDFVIAIAYGYQKQRWNQGVLFINDDIDEAKITHYTKENPNTGKSPFDYTKVTLPTMQGYQSRPPFLPKMDGLRQLYRLINQHSVVFYHDYEYQLIKRLFEQSDTPLQYHPENIVKECIVLQDAVDWIEAPHNMDFRSTCARHNVIQTPSQGLANKASVLFQLSQRLCNLHLKA
jgi:hypothetical protein